MAFNREPNKDFWGWADEDKKGENKSFGNVGAPLGAGVQASNEQAPGPMVSQDPVDAQLKSMALGKGIEATASGIDSAIKVGTGNTMASLQAPLEAGGMEAAEAAFQAADAAQLAGQGLSAAQTTGTLAAGGLEGAAAASTLSSGAGATALGTATGSSLGAGASTALTAMGPVGWTIGGLLLAKQFGLF